MRRGFVVRLWWIRWVDEFVVLWFMSVGVTSVGW